MSLATDIAYCAGIIDGEGSILIVAHNGRHGAYYDARVVCSMCHRKPIDFLQGHFGGIINEDHRARNGSKFVQFRWTLAGIKKVRPCLKKILPYLKVKKDRAHYAIDFMNMQVRYGKTRRSRHTGAGRGQGYLPQESAHLQILAKKVKDTLDNGKVPLFAGAETKRTGVRAIERSDSPTP